MASGGHAVVVGGSMAGLLAARVLSDHFAAVTIVDRDPLPEGVDFRASVPQGRHAHVLLERGRRIVEALLPGIQDEMLAHGARILDAGCDVSWLSWFGECIRFDAGLPFLAASRVFLEQHVRERVLSLPKITARWGVTVAALAGSAQRVTGLRLSDGQTLTADLVVDAGGRASCTPEWLEALGVTLPADEVVKPFVGYASRWYDPPEAKVWDRDMVIITARPPTYTRSAFVVPAENNRFIVTMAGINGDYPPKDDEGLTAFARSLEVPGLSAWLAAARPRSPVYGFRFDQNRLRHFDRVKLPAGFIAIGDAVASFNPVYGQGMTTAAVGVELLAAVLDERIDPSVLPRTYHRRLAKLLTPAWTQTTSEDLRFPGTEGDRSLMQRISYAYVDRVFLLTKTLPEVRRTLIEVLGMIEPPTALFKPSLALQVLRTKIPRGMVRPQDAPRRHTV